MINQDLLEDLACPEDKTPVSLADQALVDEINKRIAAGEIKNRGGESVTTPMDGGLVRADAAYLYRIEDGIPIMLIDEAIALEGLSPSP